MVEAPHLRLFVRTLFAPMDLTLLTHIGNMCLTRLNCLSLTGLAHSAAVLGVARDLIALPSINWLILSASFSNRAGLDLFFSRCNPALRSLDLIHLSVLANVSEPPDAPADSGPRTQITSLALFGIPYLVTEWFLDPVAARLQPASALRSLPPSSSPTAVPSPRSHDNRGTAPECECVLCPASIEPMLTHRYSRHHRRPPPSRPFPL
jgi:hypothetical protein